MNKFIMISISVLLFSNPVFAELDECMNKATNQRQLNACAQTEMNDVTKEMQQILQQIQQRHEKDPLFLKQLQKAQQAWEAFRDAEINALYPYATTDKAKEEYGSVLPVCIANAKAALMRKRIAGLKKWLSSAEEGGTCAGSIRLRD